MENPEIFIGNCKKIETIFKMHFCQSERPLKEVDSLWNRIVAAANVIADLTDNSVETTLRQFSMNQNASNFTSVFFNSYLTAVKNDKRFIQ